MKPLPKQYDSKEAEPRLQKQWEASGIYAFKDDLPREETFVIDTPPPTVSGVLHMGHIFSYTHADFVARYQRMKGRDVFYPMGFDDNGLPTERLVEKEKKVRGSAMERGQFVALCREVVKDAENQFRSLFKSTALSVDWNREYQTISDEVRALSQASFLDLLKKGEAYRDFRPTYWDWVDQTAIAQAEIENKEMPGTMNEIVFTMEGSDTKLIIATTRPELLGACVAVMYHPEDPNAARYKGKTAITPVFGVKVPMIADELVERDKGTGLVMCCTFGDDTDKEWWRKHQLPSRPVIGMDGKYTVTYVSEHEQKMRVAFAGGKDSATIEPGTINLASSILGQANTVDIVMAIAVYETLEGLKPKQANAKMLELLKTQESLVKQTEITHTVKCAERSGTPIEIIPTYQWFIKVTDKKEALLAKGAECNWHPEFMRIRLNQWIEGLKEDWCISRQRFFGVPFPVWYARELGSKSNEFKELSPHHSQLPVDPLKDIPKGLEIRSDWRSKGLNQIDCYVIEDISDSKGEIIFSAGSEIEIFGDKDVMDTWATSSISPQINARSLAPNKLYPADLRPQAHEIIRTWAFYTIVKSHLHAKSIPWKNLMISGWCLAADKSKMSKSKGNAVDPVELIRDKGADAVRYWASTFKLGADTAFSEDVLKIGKKLVTKLWNATSFAAIHLSKLSKKPGTAAQDVSEGRITETLDKWILARLGQAVAKATDAFKRFEYCDARVAIEEFFWKDFCDNYLELVKARAYGEIGEEAAHTSAHLTLYHCLQTILRLFAPFVPHVTEELYSHIFDSEGSVHARGNWPKAGDYPQMTTDALACGESCVGVLEAIRKAKSERNVSIKFPIKTLVVAKGPRDGDFRYLNLALNDVRAAGNANSIIWSDMPVSGAETEDKRFILDIEWGEQASSSDGSVPAHAK